MIEFIKKLLRSATKDPILDTLWFGTLLLLYWLLSQSLTSLSSAIVEKLKSEATLKILVSISILSIALCLTFLRLFLKNKPKINLKDFKIQTEGYYTNPKYDFEICPRCLHQERPIIAPMTRASGPWQCAVCGNKIDVKPASVTLTFTKEKRRSSLTHTK
jgi:hypothetical protein